MTPEEEKQLAERFGAVSHPDSMRGHDWCKFLIGHTWIWSYRKGWVVADCPNRRYHNHDSRPTLEEALQLAKTRNG